MTLGRTGLMLLTFVALVASASGAAAPVAAGSSGTPTTQSDVNPDAVQYHVAVRDDGTAEWAVKYRIRLDTDNRTEAFESLQSDIESNPQPYVSSFVDTISPSVERAANETGRPMDLRNASVSTAREPLVGVVVYRFEWTGFAEVVDGRLIVGDALSGFYVDETSSLRVEWPEDYEVESVTPPSDDRSSNAAIWHGQTNFGADEPRIELTDGGSLPLSLAAVAAAVLIAALGVAGRLRGGQEASSATPPDGADGTPTDDDRPPVELLSNEERVIALLEDHGGRMKQQDVAAELDWDASKTSRVVGDLTEEDAVDVFRIGRENVVTLPEEDLL